jgi:hypothetical protein
MGPKCATLGNPQTRCPLGTCESEYHHQLQELTWLAQCIDHELQSESSQASHHITRTVSSNFGMSRTKNFSGIRRRQNRNRPEGKNSIKSFLSPPISPPRPAIDIDESQSEYEGLSLFYDEEERERESPRCQIREPQRYWQIQCTLRETAPLWPAALFFVEGSNILPAIDNGLKVWKVRTYLPEGGSHVNHCTRLDMCTEYAMCQASGIFILLDSTAITSGCTSPHPCLQCIGHGM